MSTAARPARVARTLARLATALAVFEMGIALYSWLFDGFRLQLGPLRVSAGTWRHPFAQAVVLGVVAAWLFHRDASARGEWDAVPRAIRRWFARATGPIRQQPWLWGGLFAGVAASLLVCDRLASQTLVIGSAQGGWTYPYVGQVTVHAMNIATLVIVLGCAALFWTRERETRRGEWAQVCVWLLLATGFQALLRSLTPFDFEQIFLSEAANGFYTVTTRDSAASILTDFTQLRESWPMHAHGNMPGKILLLYPLELVSSQPAALAWLMVLVSNLGGLFLYVFVRNLFGDRRVALYSLVLYLFVPAKLFFFPIMNTVTPAVAFAWAILVLKWLQSGRPSYAAASGAALYGLILFEPIPLVLGVLFALVAASALWRGDLTWRRLLLHGGVLVAGFLGTWVIVRVASGFDLLDAFRRVAATAAAFNATEGRPYGVWVRQNVIDFFIGAGICQAVLLWVAFARGLSSGRSTRSWIDQPVVLVCTSLIVMFLALDLAGLNRGEVVRLWIFLACLFQIPAAWVCARLDTRAAIALVFATTIVQGALGTATIGFVVP